MRVMFVFKLALVAILALRASAKANPKSNETDVAAEFRAAQGQLLSMVRSAHLEADAFVELMRLDSANDKQMLDGIRKFGPRAFALLRDMAMAAIAIDSGTNEPLPFGRVGKAENPIAKKFLMMNGDSDSEVRANFILSAELLAKFLENSTSCFDEDHDPLVTLHNRLENCQWVGATCGENNLGARTRGIYADRLTNKLTSESFAPSQLDLERRFENSTLRLVRTQFEVPQLFPKFLLATCSLAASKGFEFKPKDFFAIASEIKTYWYPFQPEQIEDYPKMCTPPPYFAEAIRMNVRGEARDTIKRMAKKYEEGLESCRTILNDMCSRVRFIKSVPVYSYVTAQCKKRQVTSSDIDRDAKNMRARGETEATVLEHLLIKDTLQGCSKLKKLKYDWVESSPSPEGCSRQ